ncbi:fused MFS/spermidine synthase [Anaerolineales bacterium HSG6]|nr:fused MFS/spermidine synthase [Anaerolineales bacterium HSG6]
MQINKFYLLLTVFISGMTTLGVELSASRLLDPFFGNSLVIWATIIGLMLLYLTVGYFIGGRWADRDPRPITLFQITAVAAVLIGLIPFVSAPILGWSVSGFANYNVGILGSSFVAVLIIFSLPITLLGMVSPFAIRLALQDVKQGGQTAGSIYAVSTLGSLLGTFLPVLFLIPTIGTRLTFLTFAVILLTVSVIGLLLTRSKRTLPYASLFVILGGAMLWVGNAPIKDTPGSIYETESSYNYIQVVEHEDGQFGTWRFLQLNEGQGIHSVYNPGFYDFPLTDGVWDYFLVVPYFNNPPYQQNEVEKLLIIGSAAGTISKAYSHIYGPIEIDSVEIDPGIIEAGVKFFDMTEPNVRLHAQDGRYFLANSNQTYDVIAVDAYRPPYIPFHLTTREFFQEIYDHLEEDGVVAINAGRTATDYSLVDVLGTTMASVFPNVYVLDIPDYGSALGNSLVIATKKPTQLENFTTNLKEVEHPLLRVVAARSLTSRIFPLIPGEVVFTDDHAPVEQVIHNLIVRYITGG